MVEKRGYPQIPPLNVIFARQEFMNMVFAGVGPW